MIADQIANPQLAWLYSAVTSWLQAVPMVQALLCLMGFDILMGTMVAISKRRLNSTTSWRGIMRKGGALILVATGSVLQPFTSGIPGLNTGGAGPIANLIALGFIGGEFISILENAGALGISHPWLRKTLLKLREARDERQDQKTPTVKLKQDAPTNGGPKLGLAFLVCALAISLSGCVALSNGLIAVQNFAENQPIKFRYCQKLRDGQEVCGSIGNGQPFSIEARGRNGKDVIDLR